MDVNAESELMIPTEERAPADKVKIFVSYSRHDSKFVGKLVDALQEMEDFHVFLDTSDILPAEEWWMRLARLIEQSDTIVFCMSEHSLASKVCGDEVELAEKLQKRIIPAVLQYPLTSVPEALSKLNYIVFEDPDQFDQSVSQLQSALLTDVGWIREYTRIGELARRWELNGKRRSSLLSDPDLNDAEHWARSKPSNAPGPTANIIVFLEESRTEEQAKLWRFRRNIVCVALLFVGGVASWMTQDQWLPVAQRSLHHGHLAVSVISQRIRNSTLNLTRRGTKFTDCFACPEMVVVPPGTFVMGSPASEFGRVKNEGPQVEVEIGKPFAVGRFEVTFEQWQACVFAGACDTVLGHTRGGTWFAARHHYQGQNYPLTGVSWDEITEQYLPWLNNLTGQTYRLLSEAEWEYAARGITDKSIEHTAFSWGHVVGKGNANCRDCDGDWSGTQVPVGQYKPNNFGIYDMESNVSEWVQDCYFKNHIGAPNDGTARYQSECNDRVLRGGSAHFNDIRLAQRSGLYSGHNSEPDSGYAYFGFRVARAVVAGSKRSEAR